MHGSLWSRSKSIHCGGSLAWKELCLIHSNQTKRIKHFGSIHHHHHHNERNEDDYHVPLTPVWIPTNHSKDKQNILAKARPSTWSSAKGTILPGCFGVWVRGPGFVFFRIHLWRTFFSKKVTNSRATLLSVLTCVIHRKYSEYMFQKK